MPENRHPAVGEAGFEPAKAKPPDLQSGPFGRSGTPPSYAYNFFNTNLTRVPKHPKLAEGLEPTTCGLQNRCSAN